MDCLSLMNVLYIYAFVTYHMSRLIKLAYIEFGHFNFLFHT